MTDDDARKIAYYIRTKAPSRTHQRKTHRISLFFPKNKLERSFTHSKHTPKNEHTYSNQIINCAGSMSIVTKQVHILLIGINSFSNLGIYVLLQAIFPIWFL